MHDSKQLQPADRKASLTQQTQQLRRNLQTPIPAPRIALERKISLRFPHFQGFLTEYSGNISITGMFIQSLEPRSRGEILDFELDLIDGLQLIQGTGEVVWSRLAEEGPNQPAGMGIRFLRLGAESRRLIRWAVEKQISAGGEPFDLEGYGSEPGLASNDESWDSSAEPQPVAPPRQAPPRQAPPRQAPPRQAPPRQESPRQAPASKVVIGAHQRPPYAGYAVAGRSKWRSRLVPAAAIALPIIILAVAILLSMPRDQSLAFTTGPAGQAAAAVTEVAATAAAPETTGTEAADDEAALMPAATAAGLESALVDTTLAWAQAWAHQHPDAYLSHYSQRFRPPRSMSRDAWETQRTNRLKKPDFIQVDISGLETELLAPDRARVTFDQAYRSDNYHDSMRKTLDLVREAGDWKILDERAAG